MNRRTLLRLALVAVPLAATGGYVAEQATRDLPATSTYISYQGCEFHKTEIKMTMRELTAAEHHAPYYANVPVRQGGSTPSGSPIYGLAIGPGPYPCSNSPKDVYLKVGSDQYLTYSRCCGP